MSKQLWLQLAKMQPNLAKTLAKFAKEYKVVETVALKEGLGENLQKFRPQSLSCHLHVCMYLSW